jgi:hypothetical protein
VTSDTLLAIAQRVLNAEGDAHDERREHPRIQALERAEVRDVRAHTGCNATITDVSSSGMQLVVGQSFSIGTTLIVEWCSGFLPCTVRHCKGDNGMWVVGVEAELLPGAQSLLVALKESAHQRNRDLLTGGARLTISGRV